MKLATATLAVITITLLIDFGAIGQESVQLADFAIERTTWNSSPESVFNPDSIVPVQFTTSDTGRHRPSTNVTVHAGAVFLSRPSSGAVVVFNNDTGEVIGPPNLRLQAGPRASFILHRDYFDVEFGYLGVFSKNETPSRIFTSVDDQFDYLTIPTTPGFRPTNFLTDDNRNYASSYKSNLQSIECNLRGPIHWDLTVLAGVRWVNLDEQFEYVFLFDRDGNGSLDTQDPGSRINVNNDLVGFQIGMDGILWEWERFRVGGMVKSGIYYNSADHHAVLNSLGRNLPVTIPPTLDIDDDEERAAFLGEIGLTGSLRLNSRLAISVGYQLLWLDSVALAPEQISSTDLEFGTGIDISGSPFWHGGLVEIRMTW